MQKKARRDKRERGRTEAEGETRHPFLTPLLWDCHSVEMLTIAALIRMWGTEVERRKER